MSSKKSKSEDVAAEDVVTDSPKVETVKQYVVAQKCAITSKKGILVESVVVTADMLQGGEPALQALVESGHINVVTAAS